MSSAYPTDPPNSRTWWTLAPKPSVRQQGLQRQYSNDKASRSGGLSSIAVALGFKSKKHPVLAIQDPVYPTSRPSVPAIVTKTGNRPHSESVSSTRSRVDSLGPRTPADPQRDNRQSLLTISDTDPFAVRAISSAPHTPSDPNRLSAYSNASSPDFVYKNAETILNRTSYGSSSSQSNAHGSDGSPLSPSSPDSSKKLKSKKSTGNLHRKQSLMSGDQSLGSAWESLTLANKNTVQRGGSCTSLTPDKNRFSQPEVTRTPRPPMRARGMTESKSTPRDALPSERTPTGSSSSHTPPAPSPRVVVRQPSVSRIGLLPPSAPPRHGLPPPPPLSGHRSKDDDLELVVPVSTDSASSSTLSFASSVSSQKDILFNQNYSPREKVKPPLERSTLTGAGSLLNMARKELPPSSQPHTLKKAVSYQSFGRRPLPSTGFVSTPLPEPPLPPKAPRKQRSFHQPKIPLPPLSPLRPSNPFGLQTSSPQADSQPVTEQKRSSAGGLSLPGRKRLFSGSRRPSTSQSTFPEDDSQSVFSVRSFPDQSTGTSIFTSMGKPLSPTSNSFWDEVSGVDPGPRIITHEYTPQQIMTPAEMAKLEASVDIEGPSTFDRQRTLSVLSASTMASLLSDGDPSSANSVVADSSSVNVGVNKLMARSSSLMQRGLSAPPRLSVRPSTSQASMTSPTISERSSPISSISSPPMTSLPPPPRRARPRATLVEEDPILPSLPPPPGRKFVRPKISVEKVLHRRSIMKKPSFLEISDDESNNDTDTGSVEEPLSGSFLDLARESFDTSRSISE
ncbi:hypothetical protein DXG01_011919 [Tephrocybe rancida]|nr:hypothetical protein DXG01_011919 [Tephrocybe rancida]